MDFSLPQGGETLGVGIDIIEVDRVRKACERHGERFYNRILTAQERAYCESMKNPHPHIAARFAAKEAVSKAFTTGIGAELDWTSIEVCKGERGEPTIRFDKKGEKLLAAAGARSALVSLTHTANWAAAIATLVR